jgi:release factor glutamine methyltransferase
MKTPLLCDFDKEKVYDAAGIDIYNNLEDSFLFIDALEKDFQHLSTKLKPNLCLEVGSGSGIITSFVCENLKNHIKHSVCLDINPFACDATLKTCKLNKIFLIDCVNSDLGGGIKKSKQFDLILMNPP